MSNGGRLVGVIVQTPNLVRCGALRRYAPNGANQAAKVLRRKIFTESRAGCFRDVFFHQRAAEIIGASVETCKRGLEAELHPGNLNILDRAVQQNARQSVYAQVFFAAGAGSGAAVFEEPCVLMDEAERHKFREAAGALLNRAQKENVADPVGRFFDMAVHHGGSRGYTEFVRGSNNFYPARDRELVWAQFP